MRARAPDPSEWAIFIDDPVGFVYQVIGATPQEWQKQYMMAVANKDNVRCAVKACHGPGKTAVAAWLILWFLCTRPFALVPCTAPTEHQLHDKLWPELHKWHRKSKAELWRWFEWEKTKYFLREEKEEWFAVARVARVRKEGVMGAEAFGMQGFHNEHLLFIIDEASGVDDAVYAAVEGALSTEGDEVKCAAFGNPNIASGWFYQAFHKRKSMWYTQTVSYSDSPKVSNKWAEEMIENFGLKHPWVQVKVLGEFPDLLEHGLYQLSMIEACQEREVEGCNIVTIGVDVARYGDARTIFAIADGGNVHTFLTFMDHAVDEVALELEYAAKSVGASYVVIDADGIGAAVVDILKKLLRNTKIRIIEWNGNSTPNEEERYLNARSEIFWLVRQAVGNILVSLPESDALARQASGVRYEVNKDGQIVIEDKKKLIAMIGESPDELDASNYSLVPFVYPDGKIPQRGSLLAKDIVF